MENKYYTPDISEFHVGFEYESALLDKTWEISEWVSNIFKSDSNLQVIEDYLRFNRVKHLDQRDIESLGWGLDQTTKDGNFFLYGNMADGEYFLSTKDFINIEINNMKGTKNECSFQGKIKNKSELKKLMQQLGIIQQKKPRN